MDYDDEFPLEEEQDETEAEPPSGSRFGDGQQGNTSGRPTGSQNRRTIIKRVANKRHRVKIDGKLRSRNTIYLVMRSIRNAASRGDLAAFTLEEQIMRRFSQQVSNVARGVLLVPEKLNKEEWCAIYGDEMSDKQCAEQFPYLLKKREAHRTYQNSVQEQVLAAMERTRSGTF